MSIKRLIFCEFESTGDKFKLKYYNKKHVLVYDITDLAILLGIADVTLTVFNKDIWATVK